MKLNVLGEDFLNGIKWKTKITHTKLQRKIKEEKQGIKESMLGDPNGRLIVISQFWESLKMP